MKPARTAFRVLAAISFCHLLNDMMQSMIPAIACCAGDRRPPMPIPGFQGR